MASKVKSAVPSSASGIPGYARHLLLTRFPFLPRKDPRRDFNQPWRQFENPSSRPRTSVPRAKAPHVERIRHRGEGGILNDQLRQELEDLHFRGVLFQMMAVGSDAHAIGNLLSGLSPVRSFCLGFDFTLPLHGHQTP